MGWAPYSVYVFILTVLHHTYLALLEWLQFGTFLDFVIKVLSTTGISLLLIFTVELLFPRKTEVPDQYCLISLLFPGIVVEVQRLITRTLPSFTNNSQMHLSVPL